MSSSSAVRDWEVATHLNVAAGASYGGGVWTFAFQSRLAYYAAIYLFVGGGIGAGFEGAGLPMPSLSGEHSALDYTSIHCDRAFSGDDLNGCFGRVTTAGAGVGITLGYNSISAADLSGSLFLSQDVNGLGVGGGAGAFTTAGAWIRTIEAPVIYTPRGEA